MPDNCPVCLLLAQYIPGVANPWYECKKCGRYEISSEAASILGDTTITQRQRINISSWIRSNQNSLIQRADLPTLLKLPTASVGARADNLLLYLASKHPEAGES